MGSLSGSISGDVLGVWVAALLTVMVYSYLLGDNPLYRLAQHLLVGTAAAYAAIIAYHQVLYPRLLRPLWVGGLAQNWLLLIPLVMGLLLLAKVKVSWAWLGNVSTAFLFGVGAALAIGGVLFGSILPQVGATILSLNPALGWGRSLNNLIIVVGTVSTLLYFCFSTATPRPLTRTWAGLVRLAAGIGKGFILITFGALFAKSFMSYLTFLIGRIQFLLRAIGG